MPDAPWGRNFNEEQKDKPMRGEGEGSNRKRFG